MIIEWLHKQTSRFKTRLATPWCTTRSGHGRRQSLPSEITRTGQVSGTDECDGEVRNLSKRRPSVTEWKASSLQTLKCDVADSWPHTTRVFPLKVKPRPEKGNRARLEVPTRANLSFRFPTSCYIGPMLHWDIAVITDTADRLTVDHAIWKGCSCLISQEGS